MLAEAALLVLLSVERGPETSDCLDQNKLAKSVERRLKRRVFVTGDQADLRVRVTFSKRADDTEARIELTSADGTPRGTRTLVTASHCSALDDALALSVALLVDQPPEPEVTSPDATPPAQPAPATAKPPTAASQVITIPPEVATPREPWHLHFGVAAEGAWGILPELRPAIVVQLKLLPRGFVPVLVQGEGFWPSNAERDARSGARFHLLRAGLALCPTLWAQAPSSLGLCVGQKLAWLRVEGYGFDHNADERRLGYALSVGGEGRLGLFAPISLRGYLGAELPLVRDHFTSGGSKAVELFQPSPLALAAEIGLEAALW